MDKEIKIFAIVAAVMMLAVAGIAMVGVSDNSDATSGTGTMKVYIYKEVDGTMSWTHETVSGYNATKAIMGTTTYSVNTATINTTYDYTYQYEGETYYNIDSTYGTITKFNNVSNSTTGASWNMMVFTKTGSETTYSWKLGDAATGWYKPYADYAGVMPAYATANIALYYGSADDFNTMKSSLISYATGPAKKTISLTDIDYGNGSSYEYTFYIKKASAGTTVISDGTTVKLSTYVQVALTDSMLLNGITIVGYGSDAALALINAVGSNNVTFTTTTNPVPGYLTYSWMEKMFGLEQQYDADTDTYTYWQSFTRHTALGDSSNTSAPLSTGAYSSLSGAPAVDATIAFFFQPYAA